MSNSNIKGKGYSLDISGRNAVLTITGPLTAERAEDFKGPLLRALAGASDVILRAESFGDADMAIIQLLSSACQSAGLMSKRIHLEGEGVDEFLITAESAGFPREALCSCEEGDGVVDADPGKGSKE